MDLVIRSDGTLQCVYNEAIDLTLLGQLTITRGSHVEPDTAGRWFADLSPVGGPYLGPFPWRSDALAAEHVWLEEIWLSDVP